LNLRENMLFKIDSIIFEPVRNLKKLHFNPNEEVSEFKLNGSHFPALDTISMFRLEILDNKLFANFGKLFTLTMSGSSIRLIHRDAFFGMRSIALLFLQSNKIKDLNQSMSNLTRLVKVVVENNLIETLHLSEFINCKKLEQLRIAGNRIKTISLSNMKTLASQLNFVDFRNTTPELIYSFDFKSLIKVETVDLSTNSITDKRIDLDDMAKLRFLSLKDSFRGLKITYEFS
jgi:Leucine-rich repeat (LRR) protein